MNPSVNAFVKVANGTKCKRTKWGNALVFLFNNHSATKPATAKNGKFFNLLKFLVIHFSRSEHKPAVTIFVGSVQSSVVFLS